MINLKYLLYRSLLSNLFRRLPLAWLQVTKERLRLLVAIAGITFADILIFAQLGFQSSLYLSTMKPQQSLAADLVMLHPGMETLYSVKSFPRERLYQALGFEGVNSVTPLYISLGKWRNPVTRHTRTILAFGIDPSTTTFVLPGVNQNQSSLKRLGRVLFDQGSRPEFGPIAQLYQQGEKVKAELNNHNVWVTGLFTLGASFAADGNVIASSSTFLELFPNHRLEQIEVGLIKLQPNADTQKVLNELQNELSVGVKVLTREGFAQLEKEYWATATPLGFIFGLGMGMGFIVGMVIVYQILYSNVSDHLPEYATLKAMGYTDRYLLITLAQQALILAVLGYIPGFAISVGLYYLTRVATLLPIGMTITRAVAVFFITVFMCSISGAITMQKLQSADPADVF